jgi:hypothetical protein
MPWEKWVDGKLIPQPSSGRPLQKMRAVSAGPDLRPAKRRLRRYLVAQLREARRRAPARPPAIVHAVPASSPRPRAGGARMVTSGGRDGSGERDDGSGGDSDSGGGGGGEPPPRSGGVCVLERGRQQL